MKPGFAHTLHYRGRKIGRRVDAHGVHDRADYDIQARQLRTLYQRQFLARAPAIQTLVHRAFVAHNTPGDLRSIQWAAESVEPGRLG
jgi:hypothetical protein